MDSARFKMIMKFMEWDKLTDWEHDFIESVEKQFKQKGYLSEKQEEVLERIYRERQ